MLKKDSDEWWTEDSLFLFLVNLTGIMPVCDYAATDKNTKCDTWYTKEQNALSVQWVLDGWLNPPNSKMSEFLPYAYNMWQDNNINLISLVPSGIISRVYFRPIWKTFWQDHTKIDIIPVDRPKFMYEGFPQEFSARNDYMAVAFYKQ